MLCPIQAELVSGSLPFFFFLVWHIAERILILKDKRNLLCPDTFCLGILFARLKFMISTDSAQKS